MRQVFFISLIAAAATLDSLPWQNEENCGQRSNHSLSNRPKRVVGGSDALEQEVPWQVELQRFGDFICGGAVVSRHAVVTAAHCLAPCLPPQTYSVVVGSLAIGWHKHIPEPHEQEFKVDKFVLHPDWDPHTLANDVALVFISGEGMQWSSWVIPICLATPGSPPAPATPSLLHNQGEEMFLSGFGDTEEDGEVALTLQVANLPLVSQAKCTDAYKKSGHEIDYTTQFCAGSDLGGIDSCQGDSGGPVAVPVRADDRFYLAGVVSFGVGCGRHDFPGVYTRVEAYLSWLFDEMAKDDEMAKLEDGVEEKEDEVEEQHDEEQHDEEQNDQEQIDEEKEDENNAKSDNLDQPKPSNDETGTTTSTTAWLAFGWFMTGVFSLLFLEGLGFAYMRWKKKIPHDDEINLITQS